jgi:hypothetical protein
MKAGRNLALDQSMAAMQQIALLTSSNTTAHARFEKRLDDHEGRIAKLEQQ